MTDTDNKLKESIETLLSQAESREGAQNILGFLFPRLQKVLRDYYLTSHDELSNRRLRHSISVSEFSNDYFRLDPTLPNWSRAEIEAILAVEDPREAFELVSKRLEKTQSQYRSRYRRQFLEALDGAFSNSHAFNQQWMDAIVAVSPVFIDAKDELTRALFVVENLDRLEWVIINGLKKQDITTRIDMMQAAILRASDYTLLAGVLRTILGDTHPEGSKTSVDEAGFGGENIAIRSALVGRIRVIAQSSAFWEQVRPAVLLWFWWGSDNEAEVKEFTARAMQSTEGLHNLLTISVSRVRSSSGDYDSVNRKSWSMVVDLDKLALAAESILSDAAAREENRGAAQRFLTALKAGESDSF